MKSNGRGARRRTKGKNRRYGDLVKVAAQISGRSIKTVYAVLNGDITSAPVRQAIELAREQLRRTRRAAA